MPKRKAPEEPESEQPLEFLCTGGQAYPLKPGQGPSMGTAVDPRKHFDVPNKRQKGVSFGVIEASPKSVGLKVGEPLDTSRKATSQHRVQRQGSQRAPIEIDSDAGSGSKDEHDIPAEAEPTLCEEQQKVVDLIAEGHNVFYTGSAGCGKSTVLRAFVKQLTAKEKKVRICAPTNLAALNINGITTWAFAGWRPDSLRSPLSMLEQKAHGKQVWKRLSSTDVLVIDEISMCENLFFERLNAIMKAARGSQKAFGGVQLVVTGDFCQLSPVKPFQHCIECGGELKANNSWNPTYYECVDQKCRREKYYASDRFAFRSAAWEGSPQRMRECAFKHINLTQIHRQNDPTFIQILQRIRIDNTILPKDQKLLLEHKSEADGAIEIFARRMQVDEVNNDNINRLSSKAYEFTCKDFFNFKPNHKDQPELRNKGQRAPDGTLTALKDHRYEARMQLKLNMRVVLQHSLDPDAGLVNGSQGTIVDFEEFDDAKLPRKGSGGDGGEGARVLGGAHAKYAQEEIKRFAEQNGYKRWPVVAFDNGVERTVYADCMINEYGDDEPYSLLSRTQIPLMAGYAITVHKAQGMTLDTVKVDLSKAFEPSQIYVALSRARSLEGLRVTALPSDDLGGQNKEVKEFFNKYLSKS